MAKVAFVGLGNMGLAMATRLLAAGHQLSVYNRTAARAESLVRQGAILYDTPKEACEGVDAVISMVADDPASRAVWLEPDGPIGAGTAYKLIINMIGAVQIASAAEGLAIAERAGLDIALVADAIATSQAASPQVVRNTRRMVAADHDRNIVFSSALRRKDVEYGLSFARDIGIGSPFGEVAERIYRQLCEAGYAHVNESKVIDVCRVAVTEKQH
jgi:3-hydroxyisobutyrate dehydrogenase-like beta-hydroxyacid dehydrogenase